MNNCYLVSSKLEKRDSKPDKLLGVLCQVVKGPWKGYQGLVREVTDKLVTIEITSKCMKKTMPRDVVKPLSEINDEEHRYSSNAFGNSCILDSVAENLLSRPEDANARFEVGTQLATCGQFSSVPYEWIRYPRL